MRKILVPIDGSQPSIHALEYVAARQLGGEKLSVTIFFAVPDLSPILMLSPSEIQNWQTQELERITSSPKVKSLTKRLKAKVQMDTGDVATCIVQHAKKIKCHEIVMGTRGSGAMKGLLLGSVATKVVQLADAPVTLVK